MNSDSVATLMWAQMHAPRSIRDFSPNHFVHIIQRKKNITEVIDLVNSPSNSLSCFMETTTKDSEIGLLPPGSLTEQSTNTSNWFEIEGICNESIETLVRPKLAYAAPIWSPNCKTQIQQVEYVQRTAARWTCRRWRNTSSVGEMLDELQWPTLEARRDQSSLLFFHKIHCGTMSIDKDKYLTPSQSTRSTRSSHNSQYCRPQTYSDALKYSFFPRTIPHWNSLAPSVVAAETTEEFRALI